MNGGTVPGKAAEPERVARLQRNTRVFLNALRENGITTRSDSAIVPILIGDAQRAVEGNREK